jgi:AMMECR1 domain-containing protein
VFLTKDGRRAVFLPQVATEQGWDRATMLEHLSRKAGLPSDAWRRGATFEVFTAWIFGEQR